MGREGGAGDAGSLAGLGTEGRLVLEDVSAVVEIEDANIGGVVRFDAPGRKQRAIVAEAVVDGEAGSGLPFVPEIEAVHPAAGFASDLLTPGSTDWDAEKERGKVAARAAGILRIGSLEGAEGDCWC